jgi:hypothetical protein
MSDYLKLLPVFISWSSPFLCSCTQCQYFKVHNTVFYGTRLGAISRIRVT